MKNYFKRTFYIFFLFLLTAGSAQAGTSLYDAYSRQREVKIYVHEPARQEGVRELPLQDLRQSVMDALKNRKSIRFVIVDSAVDAQLTVEVQVKGYHFSETDPLDMLMGVGPAAMDAAKQDHFASMETRFVVKKNGSEVVWDEIVRGSVTDATMTEPQSYPKVFEKSEVMFVRQAFGKKR